MSPTAIGNAVASLEKRLGVRLFNRTTRNVALTSAGREYVEAIAPSLSDIRNATQAVANHSRKPTGSLRFSCSPAGGRQLLVPFVVEYRRRYNEMKVEIVTEGRLIDIVKAQRTNSVKKRSLKLLRRCMTGLADISYVTALYRHRSHSSIVMR